MTYIKAVLVGVVTGVIAVVLWVVGGLFLEMVRAFASTDSSGIGAISGGLGPATLVLLIGFAVGFGWTIRRSRQRRSMAS